MKGVDFDATVVPDCLNHPDISYHVGLANHVNCLCTVIRMETQQATKITSHPTKSRSCLATPSKGESLINR